MATKKASQFPQTILVKIYRDGDDEYIVPGATAAELGEVEGKVARYVLAGVGEIKHTAPQYVEDAKA